MGVAFVTNLGVVVEHGLEGGVLDGRGVGQIVDLDGIDAVFLGI